MFRAIVIGLSMTLLTCSSLLPAATADELEQIDDLITAGHYGDALTQASRLRHALPANERVTAWELEFQGEVLRVAHGRECFYYLLHLTNSHKEAPGRSAMLPSVSANLQRSDWRHGVVCVDLKTGKIRWSRAVNGLTYLAVDHRSDVLYLYRQGVVSLDPDSGEVLDRHTLPAGVRSVDGLLIGSRLTLISTHGGGRVSQSQVNVFNVSEKSVIEVDTGNYQLLAPDESHRLAPTADNGWESVTVPGRETIWSLPGPFTPGNLPLWQEAGLIFVAGTIERRGAVVSVNPATGETNWHTLLGWGAYSTGHHQLRGGGYQDLWTPLVKIEEQLLALDESGRLYLLDLMTGRALATPKLSRDYLAMPFQYGEQLIVPSFTSLRSYSLADLLTPSKSNDIALQVRESRCLRSLGRSAEAKALLDKLVERSPESLLAWSERAEACLAARDCDEESFSRLRAMSLAGEDADDVARERWGILRQYDLKSKPTWALREVDGKVYVGTLSGDLWSVRTDTLDLEHVTRFDHEIKYLNATTELQAVRGNSTHTREPVRPPAEVNNERIPRKWFTTGGEQRISQAVSYGGRQFRTMRDGRVRILSGTEMTDLPAELNDIGVWSIHLSPFGPLGYGAGVFKLDQDLRPVHWIILPVVDGKTPERAGVMFIQATAKSIGVVVGSSEGAYLQVYSRQGELLNEVPLGRYVSRFTRAAQLTTMGDGYLFSDRQIVWAGGSADRRVWTFGPELERTSGDRYGDRWRYFGAALVANGCLFVTTLDGQLLVFDVDHVSESCN